jgi:[ribosomal protein S5]-alanine N-acetyltransferase
VITDGVIRLRGWQPGDAVWYAATVSGDELIQRFTSESPTVTVAEVEDAIAANATRHDTAGFAICDALTGERLGNIALHHQHGAGDVSYWLAAPARGRGAATRALRLLSRWSIDHLGLTELRLWTHAENAASRRVAERAGYERDPDHDQPREVNGHTWQTVAYRLVP